MTMQALTEVMHKEFTNEVKNNNLAYVEIKGIKSAKLEGGEVVVEVVTQLHSYSEKESNDYLYHNEYVRTFTITATDRMEDSSDEELLQSFRGLFNMMVKNEYAFNLATQSHTKIKELPAKTPFVAYVGNADIRKMSQIYNGLTSVSNGHMATIQNLEQSFVEDIRKQGDYMAKITQSVMAKGGKAFMEQQGFKTITVKGSIIPYWYKKVLFNGVQSELYATPFLGLIRLENGSGHTLYLRLKDSIEASQQVVVKLPMTAQDRNALITLLELTDLRKKAPRK